MEILQEKPNSDLTTLGLNWGENSLMFSDENNIRTPKPTEWSNGSTEGKEKVVCFMRQRSPFHYANVLWLIHLPMAGGIAFEIKLILIKSSMFMLV